MSGRELSHVGSRVRYGPYGLRGPLVFCDGKNEVCIGHGNSSSLRR